ncbi:PadR family transcriptional regulator [Paenibacillus eucommiae]|uniref:DNA-binding PadR family transcriptional regulator n=1 Tax=Paenibacillus eucommiae TaxID=1355755 RepID=A0ABS4IPA1_9BACL|nr:PadR family transcriptional regulator [Paenibacillus eucommiae]MBP1989385.1 DNA-binding PadR family transcriptional regulator [Paenibacillus eucommiae]
MEYVLLGLLILKSQTIYEMNKAFQQGIALFYRASYGSLQTALKKLMQQGYIGFEEEVDAGRNKKVYYITGKGKEAFMEWMEADLPASRLESTALSKVFFLGLIDGKLKKQGIIQRIINQIQLAAAELQHMDEAYQQFKVQDSYKEVFVYQLKTLDYGIQTHRFAKEWFEGLLGELQNVKDGMES